MSTVTPKGLNRPIQLYKVGLDEVESGQIVVERPGFQLIYEPGQLTEESKDQLRSILAEIDQKL